MALRLDASDNANVLQNKKWIFEKTVDLAFWAIVPGHI